MRLVQRTLVGHGPLKIAVMQHQLELHESAMGDAERSFAIK